MDWSIIGTVLATGGIMILGYWAQHCWASKREIRDARRKYRESVAASVREELGKLQTSLAWRGMVDVMNRAESQGISLKPETIQALERLEENIRQKEFKDASKVLTELLPLASAITDEDAKSAVEETFLLCAVRQEMRDDLNITKQDMERQFKLAYQKLENFVTLAD
jgi:hypothetical protein